MGGTESISIPSEWISNAALPIGAVAVGGLTLYAVSKTSNSVWPLVLAGGIGLLALLVLYSEGKVDRKVVEDELPNKIEDPIQLSAYRSLLDNEELLKAIRESDRKPA